MKLSMILLVAALTTVGCSKQSQSGNSGTSGDSTRQQTSDADDRTAIRGVIEEFTKAYTAEDVTRITPLLSTSGDFAFFGTDSAEVIRSTAEFQKQMTDDFVVVDSAHVGEPRNLSVNISPDRSIASTIFELPFKAIAAGQPVNATVRFAIMMRKETGGWRIAQGMVAMATVGQSSAEIAAAMKSKKSSTP